MTKLTTDEIETQIVRLDGWNSNPEQSHIYKKFTFENFADALAFVNKVGAIAEEEQHHPDISFGWGKAEITLTTHDGGDVLTDKDMVVARKIDSIT